LVKIDYGSEPFLNWLDGQVQVLNAEHRNSTATDSGCSASSQSQSQTAASAHPTAAVETATDGSSEKNKI
jgi:hypothetical protein